MNSADLLVTGLGLALPENLRRYVESVDSVCAITGARITEGIPWAKVIPGSTGEYLDLMHGMAFSHVSVQAATAFKGSWNLGSRLIFEDGTMYHPFIASSSAEKSERTCWSDLVRMVWPKRAGQDCLCIMAGDFKKRVWDKATVGPLGRNTPVYVLDPTRFVSQNMRVDWEKMLSVLDFVEMVYDAGFSKDAICNGLHLHPAALAQLDDALAWEDHLWDLRSLPEFSPAILVAQKHE